MSIPDGTHRLGPDGARLTLRTTKAGAAAKAGHDLLLEVGTWEGTISASQGAPPELTLTADSRSLRVLEGSGGIKSLTDEDRSNIEQTIDDEVLRGCAIEFRSTQVTADGDRLQVEGELDLAGRRSPISFTLRQDDHGRITASAVVRQTDWGMKPYSALFGTLKVGDEVTVELDAAGPAA